MNRLLADILTVGAWVLVFVTLGFTFWVIYTGGS